MVCFYGDFAIGPGPVEIDLVDSGACYGWYLVSKEVRWCRVHVGFWSLERGPGPPLAMVARWIQFGIEDALCDVMIMMISYHDLVIFVAAIVLRVVLGFIVWALSGSFTYRYIGTSQKLEVA